MHNYDHLCMGCMNDNGGEEVCPLCGFDNNAPAPAHALSLRTMLASRYLVGKMLSSGGDGITYLGFDTAEDKIVRIKEYFPNGICARNDGLTVRVKKDSTFVYNTGIMEFLELSKKLAALGDMPGIYPVIDVFEENGTAYRVTEYSAGINFREFLLRNGGSLTWEQARPLFLPMISAIAQLHRAGIIHRGISPETLFIGRDGKLRLTDFSIAAVRNTRSDMTPQLFAGFAAIEQYGFEKATEDGTWTDVYGLAATMFRTLIGNPPPDANQRVTNDNMSFPKRLVETIPQNVLVALANALQILPDDRTATMEEFRRDLQTEMPKPDGDDDKKASGKKGKKQNNKSYAIKAAVITAALLLVLTLVLVFTVFRASIFGVTSDVSSFSGLSSMESVGAVSNTVSHAEKLYQVPDFTNKTFAEVYNNIDYRNTFEFEQPDKVYNNSVGRGKIISQSVEKNTNVAKGTKIKFTISLGPYSFKVPSDLKGMTRTEAHIYLLELGINPDAIKFVPIVDEQETEEEVVLRTSPEIGSTYTQDTEITVFYNTNLITSSDQTSSYNVYSNPFVVN